MPDVPVIGSWQDDTHAYLVVRVNEGVGSNIEYIGSVALDDLVGLTAAQRKARLVAAVKAVRDKQRATKSDLGITGTVTV